MKNNINIYIVEDFFSIGGGVKKSIKSLKEAVVVGESNDTKNLKHQVSERKPDIVIMDINLCDQPLVETIQEVKAISPQTKFLVISDTKCEVPIMRSMQSSIAGFIRKNVSQKEFLKAVRSIASGVEYYSPEITNMLATRMVAVNQIEAGFSDRELEILRYICKGRSNEQIADIITLSEKTVATHRRNIMKKASVKKTSDLILWALNNNIISKK